MSMKRWFHCLLVLMLAVSTIALTAHGVVHADAGAEQCLLCASHAGAGPAAVGEPQGFMLVEERRVAPEAFHSQSSRAPSVPLPEPRAPPRNS